MTQTAPIPLSPAQILANNLLLALKVAGPKDVRGQPGKLKSTQLQRRTGIARSTLRSLLSRKGDVDPNPDLRTLTRIADELNIPVAFLLMGPSQWQSIVNACNDMTDMLLAAQAVNSDFQQYDPQATTDILRASKVYPLQPPVQVDNRINAQQQESLERRNEVFRRVALVMGALSQTGVSDNKPRQLFAAFAAALANHTMTSIQSNLTINPRGETA